MYIVSIYQNSKEYEFVCNAEAAIALAHNFEDQKIYFKVSNRYGALWQKFFGVGGFEYWLVEEMFPVK